MRAAAVRARERALDILQHYEPKSLDDDARRELRRIVGDADRELRG
jgi:trimethylamine:corrinoid methyltransferase-like protein